MPAPEGHASHLPLDPADTATLQAFAARLNLTPQQLIGLVAHSLADHLRCCGNLQLPLKLGPPSPHCQHCPFAAEQPTTHHKSNIIPIRERP